MVMTNILIRFVSTLICPLTLNELCSPLFLFCFKIDFMMSFSDDEQADIIYVFNTSIHPDIWMIF